MSGYHIKDIKKGCVGDLSKVYEELDEVKDAEEQGVELMVLLELSDLLGAVECYLVKNHPSISLEDLIKMKNLTKRSFLSGERT